MSESMDSISCPICLDLLNNPVTTTCGHSYCMGCIKNCWDQDDQKGIYSCPLCNEIFSSRPVLRKNNLLAELVEKLKKTGLQASHPDQLYAGPGDVECDVCTGRKQKAIKFCLVCLASYCEPHLQPHYESPAFKKHKLIQASSQLQDQICSRHDKVLEVFCRTDQQCICVVCVMDEHKGHDTVSAAAGRTEKQRKMGIGQQKVQQKVQEREKELKKLQQAVKSVKVSAQTAEEDSERILTELIHYIERWHSEVKELIRAQQRAAVSQVEGQVERLEQEIAVLRRKDSELEQLSHTEDHIHFLQSYRSLSSLSVSPDLPSISVPPLHFSDVTESVSELREKLEDVIKREWSHISSAPAMVSGLPKLPHAEVAIAPQQDRYDITLQRMDNEGFGFSIHTNNKLPPGVIPHKISHTDRGGQLKVGDSISAVNGQSTMKLSHKDIVQLVMEAGKTVSLTVVRKENSTLLHSLHPALRTGPNFRRYHLNTNSDGGKRQRDLFRPPLQNYHRMKTGFEHSIESSLP